MMTNIVEIIKKETESFRLKTAVSMAERSLTYSKLFHEVDTLAAELTKVGLKERDRVAFLCDDNIEYIIVSLAILSLGAVLVPVSVSLSINEVENVVERMDVAYLLYDKKRYEQKGSIDLFNSAFALFKRQLKHTLELDLEPQDISPAFIRFSSGTTGVSKGVLLSHQAICERTNAANCALSISSEDVVIWLLSMSFHFVVTILLFLRKGAEIVLCGNNFPLSAVDAFKKHKATFVYASPFHYSIMNSIDSFSKEYFSALRMAVSTAVALDKKMALAFRNKFDVNLSQAYGIIEVGLPFVNVISSDDSLDSVGEILPDYKLKFENVDQNGCGNILIKGKGMFDAYVSPWKKRSEWFDTGDIGYVKENKLFISGRKKNVINFSGMKIYPQEVEAILNSHPAIDASLVYGQAHELWGQIPVADVVVDDGQAIDKASLRKYCAKHLDTYKLPKDITFVKQLKKTASGKLVRY